MNNGAVCGYVQLLVSLDIMKRLEIRNNWEVYDYFIDNVKIDPLEISEVKDGVGNIYTVNHRAEYSSYSDHASTCSVTRSVLVIQHPLGEVVLRPRSQVFIS